jgi:riboflavin kinase/FMN adenylyltransferase
LSLRVVRGIENLREVEPGSVVTIGTFDGLHLGHQAIFARLIESSKANNCEAIAITFEPHPRVLVTPHSPPPLLSCLNEKIKYFSEYFDGTLLVLKFNDGLKNMSAMEFTKKYLVEKIGLSRLIVGYDHAFGKDRSGTINDLMSLGREYGFDLEIVKPVLVDDMPISSTRIRRLITSNQFDRAKKLLGHPYPLSGEVIRGIGLGKKIGYPTANIDVGSRKLLPKEGVYSCSAELNGEKFKGMMFIGTNHFNPEAGKSVEVNIFNFDRDIYGIELYIYPEVYIRDNMKFEETEQLTMQLKKDKEKILLL